MLRLISFDIDGTLEVGDPSGDITLGIVRGAKTRGWLVGSCSDRPTAGQKLLWEQAEIAVDFTVMKGQLELVREQFRADNYVHIGDTDVDRWFAERADFDFIHVDDAPLVDWLRALGTFREP